MRCLLGPDLDLASKYPKHPNWSSIHGTCWDKSNQWRRHCGPDLALTHLGMETGPLACLNSGVFVVDTLSPVGCMLAPLWIGLIWHSPWMLHLIRSMPWALCNVPEQFLVWQNTFSWGRGQCSSVLPFPWGCTWSAMMFRWVQSIALFWDDQCSLLDLSVVLMLWLVGIEGSHWEDEWAFVAQLVSFIEAFKQGLKSVCERQLTKLLVLHIITFHLTTVVTLLSLCTGCHWASSLFLLHPILSELSCEEHLCNRSHHLNK